MLYSVEKISTGDFNLKMKILCRAMMLSILNDIDVKYTSFEKFINNNNLAAISLLFKMMPWKCIKTLFKICLSLS